MRNGKKISRTRYYLSALFLCLTSWSFAYAETLIDLNTQKIQSFKKIKQQIVVVNMWATWCAPCREEMPMLSQWYQKQSKSQKKHPIALVGIAIDKENNVRAFLQKTPVSYPIWLFKGNSAEWMQKMGNSVSALPYTLVHSPSCSFKEKLFGKLNEKRLKLAITSVQKNCHLK